MAETLLDLEQKADFGFERREFRKVFYVHSLITTLTISAVKYEFIVTWAVIYNNIYKTSIWGR